MDAHVIQILNPFSTQEKIYTLSIADPYLFIVCSWLAGDGVTVSDYPKITAFLARMEARDSVKSVRAQGML